MKPVFSFIKNQISSIKKISLKKKMLIIIVVIVIVVIVIIRSQTQSESYSTTRVGKHDIIESVDESGTVKISSQTDIYSPANGIIEEIYIANGDYVEKGQELFKVQSTATKQEQQSAYANYLSAQATLNAAKSNLSLLQADMFAKWDTFKELAESDYYEKDDGTPDYDHRAVPEFHIPEKQWLAAEQKFKDQQQVITQAQAAVNSTWILYQATQTSIVKSTADGQIANLSVGINDSVSANTSAAGLAGVTVKPILTVADFSVIGVLIPLGEADINKIEPGDQATIDVDPIDSKTYKGNVTRVDEIGYDDAGITKYDVFITIQNKDELLKAGMTADAVIITKKLSNVLSVPNSSIKPYEGGKAVQILNDKNEVEFLPVKIGVRGENYTQILEGLSEDQEIIVSLSNDQVTRPGLFGQ